MMQGTFALLDCVKVAELAPQKWRLLLLLNH